MMSEAMTTLIAFNTSKSSPDSGTDTVLAMGEFHITGNRNRVGSLSKVAADGLWCTFAKQGILKIGTISSFPKAPPPKD